MILKQFTFRQIKLDEIDSTNSYLMNLNNQLKQDCGTIVSADFQTKGRGQIGSRWEVEPGANLTFSVVVYPQVNPKYAFYLNIIAALAVQKTLTDLNIQSKIKWPNDILVNRKKICGILVENQISGAKISQSVIGIGLNVNQLKFEGFEGTSIKNEGVNIEIDDVLAQIYGYLDFYYDLLIQSNFDLLLKHYYQHFFWLNNWGIFKVGENQFKAKVLGITEIGLLKLALEDHSIQTYDIKEIKFIL